MTKKYEVGDKLRRVSPTSLYFTKGCAYEISDIRDLTLYVHDDFDDEHGMGAKFATEHFELVSEEETQTPVEASPTVIELLANISRRLYEAEKEITELNEKQAVFFDIDKLLKIRIFDLERQNRVQAYEINELYKAVADRG